MDQSVTNQTPNHNPDVTPESRPSKNSTSSTILNSNIAYPLDVLRREFSTVGSGKFDLFKDDQTGIAQLTIDNVERRNSLSGYMMAQMADVITELEQWKSVTFTEVTFNF